MRLEGREGGRNGMWNGDLPLTLCIAHNERPALPRPNNMRKIESRILLNKLQGAHFLTRSSYVMVQ